LVNESSATHGRPSEDKAHHVHAINRSHSELVKYARRDEVYDIVLGFLQEFAGAAIDVVKARFLTTLNGTRPLLSPIDRLVISY
jgi:hypothetical protein